MSNNINDELVSGHYIMVKKVGQELHIENG